MNLTKKHLLLGCFILLLPFIATACKKGPEETVSPKKTVNAYCKSILKQDHSDLVSVLGYSDKEAKKTDTSLESVISTKLKESASNIKSSTDEQIISQVCDSMYSQAKNIKYSAKQVSKDNGTVTYEVTVHPLDYSSIVSTLKSKIEEQIKSGKIQSKDQIKDALINETSNYFKTVKPSEETKTATVTLKSKKVTIDDSKVTRYVPEDEAEFIKTIQDLVLEF